MSVPEPDKNGVRWYGSWAGNPRGNREDKECCAESVADGVLFHQCRRARGHGKDGLFCKQHAKKHEERP